MFYGCTSTTLTQGPAFDRDCYARIDSRAGVPAITAAGALVALLERLDVARFAFTSPYVASLNDLAIAFIEDFGMRCARRLDAPMPMRNEDVAAATPDEIAARALEADCAEADAIVVSCTDYRATEAIEAIERQAGKPVVTSNQALLLLGLERLAIDLADSPLAHHLAAKRMAAI